MNTPTPTLRFRAQGVKLALPRGSEAFRLLDKAQLVEGFPTSYPAEAVRLAADALIHVGVNGEINALSLAVLRQMEAAL